MIVLNSISTKLAFNPLSIKGFDKKTPLNAQYMRKKNKPQLIPEEPEFNYFRYPLMLCFSFFVALTIIWPSEISYFNDFLNKAWYYYYFISIFAASFLLIFVIQEVSIRLDRKYRWETNPYHRLILQLLAGIVLPSILFYGFFWIALYKVNVILSAILYFRHLFILVMMLNAMCCVYYFLKLFHKGIKATEMGKDVDTYRTFFLVPDGLGKKKISIKSVAFLYRTGRYIYLRTFRGTSYAIWKSLDQVQAELDPKIFYRLNRNYLICRRAIVISKRNTKKGLDITLRPKRIVQVSREKVAEFETWIGNV